MFGQKWLLWEKSGSILGKVAVFGQSGCIRTKVVIIRQKWLFFEQNLFYSVKFVVLGQSGCIRAK